MRKLSLITAVVMLIAMASCNSPEPKKDLISPNNLRCEFVSNPMGIDVTQPRLSWMLSSEQLNEKQTAYQILVATTADALSKNEGDLWNSEKVMSDQSIHVPYAGTELVTGQNCFWKVKVWDTEGNESEWSETAKWSMGILSPEEWKAKWIGFDKVLANDKPMQEKTVVAARYLRKEVSVDKEIVRATAYFSGLGISELYVNGEKISDHVLSPGQTQFEKRVLYVSHDITENLKNGTNTIGAILGNGRFVAMRQKEPFKMETFGFPKMILQIDIEYADGSTGQILSDESWKLTANGPILENNEFDGEKYDARKEMPGWNTNGFNDSKWLDVEVIESPTKELSAQMNEPIRITETIKPISVEKNKSGKYIFDMGQNMVGWVQIKATGKAGQAIKLRFAEALKDGELYLDNIRSAEVTDIYTCKGDGEEIWEPRFTYHGFRFVEVTGYPGTPDLETILGKVIHDDVTPIGEFECSAPMMNKIYRNGTWGIRGNYRSFPTDCPQRDERQAWLGDRATGSRGESYIFDISKLYAKWIRDIGDAQNEAGQISDVCPAYWRMYNDNVTWEGTPIILTNMLYEQYGDEKIIAESYDYMKKWYVYMTDKYMVDGLLPRDSYGDWCMPPEKPELIHSKDANRITSGAFLGTSFFYHMTELMAKYAEMLEKSEDVKYFNTQAGVIKEGFNTSFLDKNYGTYVNNTATASILALAFGLVPEELEEKIFMNIIEKIEVQHDGHIPVGLVGAQFLMRTLTKYGKGDYALRFATQTDYPSWGYMVENGATTIWELWNGNTADPAMNSRNHVMLLGDLNIWFYEDIAGIKPAAPGFKEIIMNPNLIKGLSYAKGSHVSPYGKISSDWIIDADTFKWNISIPVNTKAKVHIPCGNKNMVKIDGYAPTKLDGVEFVEFAEGKAIYIIGSGDYNITSTGMVIVGENPDLVDVPVISVSSNLSTEPVKVNITCGTEDAEIRYTLDGSEPTVESALYEGEFAIDKTGLLKAKGFKEGITQSFTRKEKIVVFNEKVNGLNYTYYEGKWTKIPDFSSLAVVSSGKTSNINDLKAIAKREDFWGIQYTGKINIEKAGKYTFALSSDDGSSLYINGEQIVLNDGIHGVMERQGEVELAEGKHDIRIDFFEGNYGEKLDFFYSGVDVPRQEVPVSILFFE